MTSQPVTQDTPIAVAMSGGVDSSVAAYLLLQQGWDVIGVSMRLWRQGPDSADNGEDLWDAARACRHLGIPHHVVDLRAQFRESIVRAFATTYASGRTPNPCPHCNADIKFGALYRAAQNIGCRWFATGHYARIDRTMDSPHLLRARDLDKDQSYVLYAVSRDALAHTILPLGDLLKDDVRAIAKGARLPTLERSESQDLCFAPGANYAEIIQQLAPSAMHPGAIRDIHGKRLGTHKGLAYYTVGQRRGLGISAPQPYYVVGLDAAANIVVVAHANALGRRGLDAHSMRYQEQRRPPAGSWLRAQVRYRASAIGATMWPLKDHRARLVFARGLRDITPGQHVVLYRGEHVIGGGIIEHTLGREEA